MARKYTLGQRRQWSLMIDSVWAIADYDSLFNDLVSVLSVSVATIADAHSNGSDLDLVPDSEWEKVHTVLAEHELL